METTIALIIIALYFSGALLAKWILGGKHVHIQGKSINDVKENRHD